MMKKAIQIILIASIIISFVIFLRSTDIHESLCQIGKLHYSVFYILISTTVAYFLGTLGWRASIDSDKMPSLPRLFALRHICNIITVFNPSGALAGELYNANMLIQAGVSKDAAYKSVFMSRAMMVISQLSLFLVIIVGFLFGHSQITGTVKNILYIAFVVFLIIVGLLSYFILKKGKERDSSTFTKKWQHQVHRIREIRASLAEYIKTYPKKAIAAYVFFTLHWIVGSLELYFIINALGYNVSIMDTLFLDTFIIIAKSAVNFIPGQIGAEELINKFALRYLVNLKSASSLWLSVSILRRSRQLFWSLIAFIFYLWIKQSMKKENSVNF